MVNARDTRTPRKRGPQLCLALGLILTYGLVPAASQEKDPFKDAREAMVREQIMRSLWGRTPVRDEAVLEAMRTVPRHRFVPRRLQARAYDDTPLPIGLNQTISQPYIVATMTEHLKLEATHSVLEIGTGSGYQAAVLAQIVESVYTIEIVPELGERAARILTELGYKNIHTRIGDGYKGWEAHAPYDRIIVTAAPDHVPQPLLDQLKPGGRMVIPVGPQVAVQQLLLIEKDKDGAVKQRVLEAVRFVPLTRDKETPER